MVLSKPATALAMAGLAVLGTVAVAYLPATNGRAEGAEKPAADATSWSTPVNGLKAQLSFVRKDAVNGTPIIATYLELKNVSQQGNVMEITLDPAKIHFTVTDAAGKEVQPDNGPFDGLSVDLGVLRLPWDSSLRFNISSSGAGIPNGQAGLLDLGASRDWVFKSGDKGKYYLQGRFTVEKGKDRSWSGTVVLPKVKIPTAEK